MSERWRSSWDKTNRSAKVRVAVIAQRQWGRVTWAQLRAVGLDRKTIVEWTQAGYLHQVLPRVYAVGHLAPSIEGDLAAALLYAGPGAMLAHATGVWWWELIDERPRMIEVSTLRRCKSLGNVRVHARRGCDRVWRRGLPVTHPSQTLLDYAETAPFRRLRRAISQADYRRLVTLEELEQTCGRGCKGSAKLRQALKIHQPRLALTRSTLEVVFFELCERYELPLPLINVRLEGFLVDAFWPASRLVVEVDGGQAHGTPARVARDRANELALRASGYRVIRYSRWQVTEQAALVAADVRTALDGS